MFSKNQPSLKTIQRDLYSYAATCEEGSSEYTQALHDIKILEEARAIRAKRFLSPDTVVSAMASLAGIVAILKFEQIYPLASKAIGFVSKIRI